MCNFKRFRARIGGNVLAALAIVIGAADADDRPNLVVIMADDMGFSDLGCYGGEIQTPHLDRIAAQGLRLTQFYNNAKCEPTRASLLTGKYYQRVGASPTVVYSAPTFGEVLRAAGYRTLMTGKWHAGQRPFDRGFDRHFGLTDGCCNFFNPGFPRQGEAAPSHKRFPRRWAIDGETFRPFTPSDPNFYTTDAFTDYAIRYLDDYQHEDRPFLLYVAYTAPHYPMHAWPEDIAKYRGKYRIGWHALRQQRQAKQTRLGLFSEPPEMSPVDERSPSWDQLTPEQQDHWDLRMAVYAAMIDRMDQCVGRLLDKIDQLGETKNTLVMFLSDNGGESANNDWSREPGAPAGPRESYRTVGQPWANASNTPFRKYKTFNHEGGIATPLIAYWPGVIQPRIEQGHVSHIIDVLPTLAELAEAEYPTRWHDEPLLPLDGKSLAPLFRGESPDRHDAIFWRWGKSAAVREGDWKLVRAQGSEWELYNLIQDRTELHDLAARYPDRVRQMSSRWESSVVAK